MCNKKNTNINLSGIELREFKFTNTGSMSKIMKTKKKLLMKYVSS